MGQKTAYLMVTYEKFLLEYICVLGYANGEAMEEQSYLMELVVDFCTQPIDSFFFRKFF